MLIQVNPVREKKLTNVRNTGSEEKVSLSPPRLFTLEDAIGRLHHRVGVTLVAIQKVFCAVSSSLLVLTNIKHSSRVLCVVGYVAEDELIEVTPSKIRFG